MAVAMTFTADGQKAQREIAKLETKVVMLTRKLKGVGKAGRKASTDVANVGAKAISTSALQSLSTFAAGYASITKAVDTARQAMQNFRDTQDQAASRITTVEGARARLGQVAKSPADLAKLIGNAERLRKSEGFGAIEAFNLVFEARSAELDSDAQLKLFGSLRRIAFSPSAALKGTQILQANFGGSGAGDLGGGSARQVINKALAAAANSPVGAEKIINTVATSAVEFAAIGGQDEALLAMLSPLSKTFESPKAASQRIKSLSTAIARRLPEKELQRRGIEERGFELFRVIPGLLEAGKLPGKGDQPATNLVEFLQNAEAVAGLNSILAAESDILKVRKEVRAAEKRSGGPLGLLSTRFDIVDSDQQIVAARNRRKSQESRRVQEEGLFGVTTLNMDSLIDRAVIKQRQEGASGFTVGAFEVVTDIGRFILGDENFARAVGHPGAVARQTQPSEAQPVEVQEGSNRTAPTGASTPQADVLIGKLERVVDGLAEATTSMSGGPTLRRPDEDI